MSWLPARLDHGENFTYYEALVVALKKNAEFLHFFQTLSLFLQIFQVWKIALQIFLRLFQEFRTTKKGVQVTKSFIKG